MTLRVFVSGQSNSLGRNTGGPDWSTISADVRVWNNVNPLGANGSSFTTAALARAGGTFENTDRNNFAVWFCHRLAEETGDTVDMTIVSRGASQIELWDPSEVTYPMLQECIDVWTATGQAPADIFLWHQGEGNVGNSYATYSAKFFALLSDLTAGGVIDANTIVIVGELSRVGDLDKVSFNDNVLDLIGSSAPGRACARSTRLPTDDGTHFTGDALYWFGYDRYYKAYLTALYDPMYALVNVGGTPGAAGTGDNAIVDFNVVREALSQAATALQPGDSVAWTWLSDVPANTSAWELIPPSEVGVVSTATEVVDWDATFGARARFMGYTNGVSTGGPIAASGVGILIPRASNQAAEVFIQTTSSGAQRAWFRGGGSATWGPWCEFWHSANFDPAGYLPLTGGTLSGNLAVGSALITTSGGISAANGVFARAGGGTTYLRPNGATDSTGELTVSTAGNVTASGTISDPAGNVRVVPAVTANATTTLTSSHLNTTIEKSGTSAYTYTIAPSLGARGDMITIVNSGTAGDITLARGSGVALYRNGTNADLVLGPGSITTIYRSATSNRWIA